MRQNKLDSEIPGKRSVSQMVYFHSKNPYLGKSLEWEMLVYDWPFGIFYGKLVYFTAIWFILWRSGIFRGHLVCFFPVLVCCTEENLATLRLNLVASQKIIFLE
jgi:hypothetical protein